MKRLVALLLCATMLIAFVACDEKNAPASSETETETRETSAEKKTEEETETEEKTSETPVTTTKGQGSEAPSTTTKAQGGAPSTTTKKAPTTTTKAPTTTTKHAVTHFINTNVEGRYEQGKLSVVLLEAYWEGSSFVAKVAIVNTSGKVATGVYLESLIIRGTGGVVVCDAGFTSQGQGFTINNNEYYTHIYRMSGDAAPNRGSDLSTTSLSATVVQNNG
ncbi:MAG: hypothetical protein IJC84_05925 [Clostridia bacterium]|nr:hypothetical protein [Clostridia bacterium]